MVLNPRIRTIIIISKNKFGCSIYLIHISKNTKQMAKTKTEFLQRIKSHIRKNERVRNRIKTCL